MALGKHVHLTEDLRAWNNTLIKGQNKIIHLLKKLVQQNEELPSQLIPKEIIDNFNAFFKKDGVLQMNPTDGAAKDLPTTNVIPW